MTDRIAEITARCEAATPGPWYFDDFYHVWSGVLDKIAELPQRGGANLLNNAEFISNAREDIPYLLTQLAERDKEIERLHEAQRWISVEERLPEHTDDYNVVCNIGSMLGGYRDIRTYRFENIKGRDPKWCVPNRFDEVVGITHWQALPQPPEKGEQ